MPSQPSHGQATSLAYAPDEWELLTHLPARVMIAAASAEADSTPRTVAEGIAGLEAIAAGRNSDSDLVRAVVAAIYAASDADAEDDPPTAEEFTDRPAGPAEVLAACRTASALLSARADPADAAAYRQWLQTIAARVCGASGSGGALGLGAARVSTAEQRFLADLGEALHR